MLTLQLLLPTGQCSKSEATLSVAWEGGGRFALQMLFGESRMETRRQKANGMLTKSQRGCLQELTFH